MNTIPTLPIREREKALVGTVITEEEMNSLLAQRVVSSKSRFKGAREATGIRR